MKTPWLINFRGGSEFKPHITRADLDEDMLSSHTAITFNKSICTTISGCYFRLGSAFAVRIAPVTLFYLEIAVG